MAYSHFTSPKKENFELLKLLGELTCAWNFLEAIYPIILYSIYDEQQSLHDSPITRHLKNVTKINITEEVAKANLAEPDASLALHINEYFDRCRIHRNLIIHGAMLGYLDGTELSILSKKDSLRRASKKYLASKDDIKKVVKSIYHCTTLAGEAYLYFSSSPPTSSWKKNHTTLVTPEVLASEFPLPEKMHDYLNSQPMRSDRPQS